MRLQLLEQDVGRNFEENIRHEENRQCGVIFRSRRQAQFGLEAENGGITDINTMRQVKGQRASNSWMRIASSIPVQKGKQIQNTQARQDVPVNLGHQLALGGFCEGRQLLVIF